MPFRATRQIIKSASRLGSRSGSQRVSTRNSPSLFLDQRGVHSALQVTNTLQYTTDRKVTKRQLKKGTLGARDALPVFLSVSACVRSSKNLGIRSSFELEIINLHMKQMSLVTCVCKCMSNKFRNISNLSVTWI